MPVNNAYEQVARPVTQEEALAARSQSVLEAEWEAEMRSAKRSAPEGVVGGDDEGEAAPTAPAAVVANDNGDDNKGECAGGREGESQLYDDHHVIWD